MFQCNTKLEIASKTEIKQEKKEESQGDFSVSGIIVMELESKANDKFKVRTLLDSGAGTNFISQEILSHIKYEKLKSENLIVSGINTKQEKEHQLIQILLANKNCPVKYIKCYVLPNLIEYNLNEDKMKEMIEECKNLQSFKDPFQQVVNHKEGIGIVLSPGATRDISYAPPIWHGKYSIDRTYFGIAISGRISQNNKTMLATLTRSDNIHDISTLILNDVYNNEKVETKESIKLSQELKILYDKEMLGVHPEEMHKNDKICVEKFKKEVYYDRINKRYEIALPWNENKWQLPTNINVAYSRMRQLQVKFIKVPEFGKVYEKHVLNLEKENYIEEVTENTITGEIIHFLPHTGIIKDDSVTTALRMVMDGSSKRTASEFSLNDVLYTGPNLITEITKCIIKLRCGEYAATSDMEKAFLKLIVKIKDRDALRFFFPTDIFDLTSTMKIYRYKVVLFGASCSPFLLAAVIQKHLELMLEKDDQLTKTILEGLYVDNLFVALNKEKDLIEFFHKTRHLFQEAGLNLRQWGSNSELLNEITKENNIQDQSDLIKVLGLRWNTKTDELEFNKKIKINVKYSKRKVLETSNSLFDPLGYLIPVEIKCRLFIQQLWEQKLDWDMLFNDLEELKKEWDNIRKECKEALEIKLERKLLLKEEIELHIFSDASKLSYGAVAYLVIPKKTLKEGNAQFLMSKAKITSIKKSNSTDTIPKLEMMGMLIAANLSKFCLETMKNYNISKKIIWSDSKVVLAQCSSVKSNKNAFVHNRVVKIRDMCKGFEIKYVNSFDNPADLTTRPITANQLKNNNLWKTGPTWLTDESNWQKEDEKYNLFPIINQENEEWKISQDKIQIKVKNLMGQVIAEINNKETLKCWKNNYEKTIRFFAIINRLKKKAKKNPI